MKQIKTVLRALLLLAGFCIGTTLFAVSQTNSALSFNGTSQYVTIPDADEILQCSDGTDVRNIYDKQKPELVFMDIKMKGMNGIEATRLLKEEYPDAKVVIVTGYTGKAAAEAAALADADGFVTKDNLSELKKYFQQNI